jgi:transposase-like protein
MHRVAKQTLESIDEQIESLAKELQDLQASRAQMAAHAEVEKQAKARALREAAKERLVESLAALAELQKHVDGLKKEAGDG